MVDHMRGFLTWKIGLVIWSQLVRTVAECVEPTKWFSAMVGNHVAENVDNGYKERIIADYAEHIIAQF